MTIRAISSQHSAFSPPAASCCSSSNSSGEDCGAQPRNSNPAVVGVEHRLSPLNLGLMGLKPRNFFSIINPGVEFAKSFRLGVDGDAPWGAGGVNQDVTLRFAGCTLHVGTCIPVSRLRRLALSGTLTRRFRTGLPSAAAPRLGREPFRNTDL